MKAIDKFNVRVYGIYVQDQRLLVTDELRGGYPMTKLPGGGLEFGEGIEDCLIREWQEELEVDIEVKDLFFVNRFLLQSAFAANQQVIALYFTVKPLGPLIGHFTTTPMDFLPGEGDKQAFRWLNLVTMTSDDFTFPTDKSLLPELKARLL